MSYQFDIICFSHLRWDFVYQRPQHLMSRFAGQGRVFFVEEAVEYAGEPFMNVVESEDNVFVCTPNASKGADISELVTAMVNERKVETYVVWFYTPMMLEYMRGLSPKAVVYDCMDQLSAFRGAPPEMLAEEQRLFQRADLVFTGGLSLYEAKRDAHPAVHLFPSSIDVTHFAKARAIDTDVPEQAGIPHPRIGFAGVIDERSDLDMLGAVADLRPEWSLIMVGPVVKIDEAELPRRPNIHYIGQKDYSELPAILSGWDAAMMPFALNESTRYISPTKTPEYLAAGLPVVSTPIADVMRAYGELGLVHIAATPAQFVDSLEKAMAEDVGRRRKKADESLADLSWDKTFREMHKLIRDVVGADAHAQTGTSSAAEATCREVEAGAAA